MFNGITRTNDVVKEFRFWSMGLEQCEPSNRKRFRLL